MIRFYLPVNFSFHCQSHEQNKIGIWRQKEASSSLCGSLFFISDSFYLLMSLELWSVEFGNK